MSSESWTIDPSAALSCVRSEAKKADPVPPDEAMSSRVGAAGREADDVYVDALRPKRGRRGLGSLGEHPSLCAPSVRRMTE
jgi:hypothetical protein